MILNFLQENKNLRVPQRWLTSSNLTSKKRSEAAQRVAIKLCFFLLMKISPAIVYGFPSKEKLEHSEYFKVGLTHLGGTPVYYINECNIAAINITQNETTNKFNKFARFHDKLPGLMLILVVDFDPFT